MTPFPIASWPRVKSVVIRHEAINVKASSRTIRNDLTFCEMRYTTINRLAARIFPSDIVGLYENTPEMPLKMKKPNSA